MKILIDMNLSPDWVERFAASGIESVHWSTIGNPKADDAEIMKFALDGGYVVFTHDLDFSAILAATAAKGPSVIQVRTQNILPDNLAPTLISVLREHGSVLSSGAILTIDEAKMRIRTLPLRKH